MQNIVLIGRPNVGKSTIYNSLVESRIAIEADLAGTTRDLRKGIFKFKDKEFHIYDTPGYDAFDSEINQFSNFLQGVVEKGILIADIILFVVDIKDGIMHQDKEIAKLLRRSKKPVILVVNKVDNDKLEKDIWQFTELGFEEIINISSIHRKGLDKIKKFILKNYDDFEEQNEQISVPDEIRPPKIAIVGRPNVGKSSLLNAIVGDKIAIVSEIPGTTRDSIDTIISREGKTYQFIDTAGIRKAAKLKDRPIERLSVMQTEESIKHADVCMLLLDSTRKIEGEDMATAKLITKYNKSCFIVITKWDDENPILTDKNKEEMKELEEAEIRKIQAEFQFFYWVPAIFTSAKTGLNLDHTYGLIDNIYNGARTRIETKALNNWLNSVIARKAPTGTKNVIPKINYVSQVSILPPKFVFFINKTDAIHFSYQRFLENELRHSFGFNGVHLDLEFTEKRKNEYH